MRLRKYKKFSETSREVPEHRDISFLSWGPEYQGRKLKFVGDIEDVEEITDEPEEETSEDTPDQDMEYTEDEKEQ